jgi:hypothetical protein
MRASRRAVLATPREIPSAGHAKSANFAIVSWDPYDARKTAQPRDQPLVSRDSEASVVSSAERFRRRGALQELGESSQR